MKAITRALVCASVVLFLVVCAHHLSAQGLFGTISGVVTDSTGAVVSGATIKVTNIDTGVTSVWKTNGAGVYNATSLNPGAYRVEAEAGGFKPRY